MVGDGAVEALLDRRRAAPGGRRRGPRRSCAASGSRGRARRRGRRGRGRRARRTRRAAPRAASTAAARARPPHSSAMSATRAGRERDDAGGGRELVHGRKDRQRRRRERTSDRVAGARAPAASSREDHRVVWRLLSVFCSPRTAATATFTRRRPDRRRLAERDVDLGRLSRPSSARRVLRAVIVLPLPRTVRSPARRSRRCRPGSGTSTWNVTRAVAGTRLTTGDGWSVLSPTDTLVRPWPCRPGAGGWFGAPAVAPIALGDERRAQPPDVAHELAVRDPLAGHAGVVERLLDERRDARLVDDVRGEEVLHVPGDPGDRVRAGWPRPSAVGRSAAILRSAVGAEVERQQELVLRGLHVAGHVELPRAAASSSAARRSWLTCTWRSWPCWEPLPSSRKSAWPTSRSELGDDRRHVAVVGLERVLLLARGSP